ncbi:MAG: DNA-binding domain-containing protein [Pseudomonadota bacterium]
MNDDPLQRERQRQQALLQALWHKGADETLLPQLQPGPLRGRGLQAYRANAGAHAQRTLEGVYPVVQALVGEEAFGALARACWRRHPPEKGDLAWFAASLPACIESETQLAELPYLADVARLEWMLSQAEAAADREPAPGSFGLLASQAPEQLRFTPAPGFAVLRSAYPVHTLWRAHQPGEAADALFEAAGAQLRAGQGEAVLVWRQGWKARAQALTPQQAGWCEALQAGRSIDAALVQAGEGFAFEAWLHEALARGWVLGVEPCERPAL